MPKTRIPLRATLLRLALALSSLAFVGCSGSRDESAPSFDTPASAPVNTATAAPVPSPTPLAAALKLVAPDEVSVAPLYVADVATGEILKVGGTESTDAFGFQAWLPDGRMLVTCGEALFVLDLDKGGLLTKLWEGDYIRSASVSPDGELIAFTIRDHLVVARTDGTGTVGTLDALGADWAAWAPDGQWLAFTTGLGSYPALPPVFVAPRGDLTAANKLGEARAFAWSPTGSRLALAIAEGFVVVDLPSGEKENVYQNSRELSAMLAEGRAWVYGLSWSPSSKYLALDVLFTSQGQGAKESAIVVPLGDPGGVEIAGARFGGWLPGRDVLIVTGNICSSEDEELLLVTPDGRVQQSLGRSSGIHGPASPDGNKVAFTFHIEASTAPGQPGYKHMIKIANLVDGTEKVLVSSSLAGPRPYAWSPDSSKLAFVGSGGRGWCEGGAAQTLEIHPIR